MSAISPIHEYARRARVPVVGKEGALSEGDLRGCTATCLGVAGGEDCGKCARKEASNGKIGCGELMCFIALTNVPIMTGQGLASA